MEQTAELAWRKSRRCDTNTCVEVARWATTSPSVTEASRWGHVALHQG